LGNEVSAMGRLVCLLACSLTTLLVATAGMFAPARALAFAAPVTFGSTGAEQSYTVPSGVLLEGVLVQGASGGSDDAQPGNTTDQNGAALQGYLQATPGQTLYAEVGQNGTAGGGATFGGGGAAGGGNDNPTCSSNGDPCAGALAGSGGGASDVRTCSMFAASCSGGGSSLDSRLIVAAGGGGDGAVSPGGCASGEGFEGAGEGQNNQLPTASSAGPAAIDTAAGIVIPGFAGGDLSTVTTVDGITNAAMGATAAGAGGSFSGCTVNNVELSGSSPGQAGSGADGGAGGDASGFGVCCGSAAPGTPLGGAGGGGGGGYFGGGGGSTGASTCSPSPCGGHTSGEGGGAGSSFVANATEYPTFTFPGGASDVIIEFWPVIEIDTPANGAVYSPGQVVDASWECAHYSNGPGGCNSSSGTVPSGSPIDTTPGTHTFTVNGKVNVTGDGSQPVSATVTYTVSSGGGGGGASGAGGGGASGAGGGTKTVHAADAGLAFALTGSANAVPQGQPLSLTLSKSGSSKAYRVISYSYYIGAGVEHRKRVTVHGEHRTITVYMPNVVRHGPGIVNLSAKDLSAGVHRVKVVILLRATRDGQKPTTKTLTLKLSITVA
jgi:hypothetical protein